MSTSGASMASQQIEAEGRRSSPDPLAERIQDVKAPEPRP